MIHPGTELNKFQDKDRYSFCSKIKIYYNTHDKVDHCTLCNVCITKIDHHCVWVENALENIIYVLFMQ